MSGEHADPPELLSEVSVYLKRRVYPDPFFCCVCLKIKRPGKRIAVDEKVLYPIRYSRIEDLVKTSSFISFIRILESDLGVTVFCCRSVNRVAHRHAVFRAFLLQIIDSHFSIYRCPGNHNYPYHIVLCPSDQLS